MPPARTHRCADVARLKPRSSMPISASLNCTMPALVNSSVLSPAGTSELDGTTRCPRSAKNSRYFARISDVFIAAVDGAAKKGAQVYTSGAIQCNALIYRGIREARVVSIR